MKGAKWDKTPRERLLQRVSDVLRRSGVPDAEALIKAVESRLVGCCLTCGLPAFAWCGSKDEPKCPGGCEE